MHTHLDLLMLPPRGHVTFLRNPGTISRKETGFLNAITSLGGGGFLGFYNLE